jgi:chromate transporter
MKSRKTLFGLFLSMLKIGLFTFGGGYAMIGLLEDEFVTRRGWIGSDEFVDLVAVAESTPGPIAINCSTYIGFKRAGIWGALVATIGMVLPSLTIIYLISLFFESFLSVSLVASAFRGVQVCVVFLILRAGVNMLRKMKKTPFSIVLLSVSALSLLVLNLFAVDFSTIIYVVLGAIAGLTLFAIRSVVKSGEGEK